MPAVVVDEDPADVLSLLELPQPRLERHVPAALAGGDHLHVEPRRFPDLAGLHDAAQHAQRLVEDVVLHHPQHATGVRRGPDHLVGLGEIRGHGLLQVHMEAGPEGGAGDLAMEGRGDQQLHDVHVVGEELREIRIAARLRELGPAGGDLRFVPVAQGDHLHLGEAAVGGDVEVVDATEAHDPDSCRSIRRDQGGVHRPDPIRVPAGCPADDPGFRGRAPRGARHQRERRPRARALSGWRRRGSHPCRRRPRRRRSWRHR